MNRREFVASTAALALPSNSALALQSSSAQPSESGWFDKPMRWAQVVFVEDDPGNYSPKFWFDYFRRIHADAACLGAGGYMAFYPTKVPFHYKSRFLREGMDPLGEMVKGCRELGMNVIARTDPHACHNDLYEAHPDWIAVDESGKKVRHWADPRLWVTCSLGPYNWEFMTAVTREIVQLYKVDGVFCNRWEGPAMCYCEHCTKNFRAAAGLDLPRRLTPADKSYRAYLDWRQNRFFELWKLWDREIQAISPTARFIPNTGGAERLLDMDRIGDMASTLFYDRQARRGAPAWFNGRFAKEYRSTLKRKPIAAITSVGHEDPYRWKDSVQSGDEIRMFIADGIANGAHPWFAKFNAKVIDQRWMKPVEDIYTWAWKHESYLRNVEPLARVAMVYSQATVHHYAAGHVKDKYDDHVSGFYHALIESRVPFEMVNDRQLTPENIDRFRALLLPNVAALSEGQCAQLTSYVERGGSVVATFETSLYDEWGQRRADFGLRDLFGCSFAGKVEPRMQNSYLSLEHSTKHPLLRGLEDTPRIINGVRRVATNSLKADYKSPLTLIPTYPDLPMEEVYPRSGSKTTQPEVYAMAHGRGRVVYFPFDLDRTFWEVLSVDHLKLLRNAVEWSGGEQPLTVSGPGVLDVTAWRQKQSIAVHLVNLTNPMFMKGPVRELIPVGAQSVSVALPAGAKISGVHLLTAGTKPAYKVREGRVELEVPSILLHEVVAIDLA
jgi:hypothetical protein